MAEKPEEKAKEPKVDIKVKKETGAPGIKITPTVGEIPPPLPEPGTEEPTPEEEIEAGRVTGKIPLSPAVIKPPLRFEGMFLAEMTGYPGWMYTEEDLEDIAELIRDCGWEADPRLQILISLFTLHGAKFTAYTAWKRKGRPGDLKKIKETGEMEKTKRPKAEEVKV